MNEINRERFEAWLFSQEPQRIIEAGDGTRCFLCSFVKETSNLKSAFFKGWDEWMPSTNGDTLPLPEWAMRLIDRGYCFKARKGSHGHAITVAQMQARYISLFGDPRIVDEPAQATPPLIHASGLA